jgi:hypothetical protein
VGIALLAALNVAEVIFPRIKPLTLPLMVVALVFVIAGLA